MWQQLQDLGVSVCRKGSRVAMLEWSLAVTRQIDDSTDIAFIRYPVDATMFVVAFEPVLIAQPYSTASLAHPQV